MARIEQIVSSHTRLEIAELISRRPRSLHELASKTQTTVQGVLKHLKKLDEMGLLEELRLENPRYLAIKKIYSIRDNTVHNFSIGDLLVVNLCKRKIDQKFERASYSELMRLAEEKIILSRRVRSQVRKLARMIDQLFESESEIKERIKALNLSQEEKVIAEIAFSEESMSDAILALSRYFGCREPEEIIRKVMVKVRKVERE